MSVINASRLRELHPARALARMRRPFILGLKSLWLHSLRSLLTVLGIVFGVCSVIAMLAVGEGASYEAQEQIKQLGSSNIIIQSVKPPDQESSSSQRSFVVEYGVTYKDVEQIEKTIPGIIAVSPARIFSRTVWVASRKMDADVVGTMPYYLAISSRVVARGRYFTEAEQATKKNVCLLDETLATTLFPIDDPLGKAVRIEEDYFTVIGIMKPRDDSNTLSTGSGATGVMHALKGSAAPSRLYIPLAAAKGRFGETLMKRSSGSMSAEKVELHEVTVKVGDSENVIPVSLAINDLLTKNHKKNDFKLVVPLQLLQQAERTKRMFSIVLGSVAAISLLVGGIGIMNIMLATVTERTREIGIRRALGAKRRDIIFQFLIETVLLSATGGIIGVILGLAIPFFITAFTETRTIVTFWSPMIAFGISAIVGIIFGIYPAMRAANMDPVEALRHE